MKENNNSLVYIDDLKIFILKFVVTYTGNPKKSNILTKESLVYFGKYLNYFSSTLTSVSEVPIYIPELELHSFIDNSVKNQ